MKKGGKKMRKKEDRKRDIKSKGVRRQRKKVIGGS